MAYFLAKNAKKRQCWQHSGKLSMARMIRVIREYYASFGQNFVQSIAANGGGVKLAYVPLTLKSSTFYLPCAIFRHAYKSANPLGRVCASLINGSPA